VEYNPNEQKAVLIPSAKYVALCFKGKDNLSRKGVEWWVVHYVLIDVFEASADVEDDARGSIGKFITDKLFDTERSGWVWDMFLPAMFPEIKKSGEKVDVHARNCPGKIIVLRLGEGKGNQDRGEPEKVNKVYGYEPFTGDVAQYAEAIKKYMPEEEEAPPSTDSSPPDDEPFENQF
jgi:hypothetical protein